MTSYKKCRNCCVVCFTPVIALFLFIVFLIPFIKIIICILFFKLFKFILKFYLSCKHGGQVIFLTGLDAVYAQNQQDLISGYINAFVLLKGHLDMNNIRSKIVNHWLSPEKGKRNVKLTRLYYCLHQSCGFYYWACEKNFNLEDHLKLYTGIAPKNDKELHLIYGEINTKPMSGEKKSQWCVTVIPLDENFEGFHHSPHYVLLLQMHHTLGDSASLTKMITNGLLDDGNTQFHQVSSPINQSQGFIAIAKAIFFAPLIICRLMTSKETNLFHGPKLSGTKLVGVSSAISLKRVKRIKNVIGTSVNDVLMSCISAAIRSCYVVSNVKIPSSFHVTIPIEFHNLGQSLEMKNCCCLLAASFALPIRKENSLVGLKATRKCLTKLQSDSSAITYYILTKILVNSLPYQLTNSLIYSNGISAIVSNVQGPKKKCTAMNGHEILQINVILPHVYQIGLSFSTFSCNENVWFSLSADSAIIPTQDMVHQLLSECVNELNNLEQTVLNKYDLV